MDLINSVTQNSNNRSTTLENRAGQNENENKSSPIGHVYQKTNGNSKQLEQDKRSQVPDYLRAIGMDPRKYWPKKYRFTREKSPGVHNPLTISQRNFYESNGYIVLDDCLPRNLLDTINSNKQQLRQLAQKSTSFHLKSNPNLIDAKQSDFVDEFLLDKLLVKNEHLAQYVKCFCDEKFMLMTRRLIENFQSNEQIVEELIKKQGLNITEASIESQLLSGAQKLQRDWIYLPFRPIDKVVATIVALEPIEHVILLVPGTHRVGQCTISTTLETGAAAYKSSQPSNDDCFAPVTREIYESSPDKLSTLVSKSRKGFKYINLKPGQTLFYHPSLVHGFSNDLIHFNKPQLAVLAYFAAADCEFVDLGGSLDLNGSGQPIDTNHGEQVPVGLAHFGDRDPRDYRSWLDKPRHINDSKSKL